MMRASHAARAPILLAAVVLGCTGATSLMLDARNAKPVD